MTSHRGICLLATLMLLASAPALAQVNYYNADTAKKPAAAKPAAPQTDDANGGMPDTASGSASDAPDATSDDANAAPDDGADGTDNADNSPVILPAQSSVVTSIDTCLNQLDPADAAEIRNSYIKPYQECQSRLAAKLAKKKTAKVTTQKNGLEAESPRNFVRVQTPKTAPKDDAGTDADAPDMDVKKPVAPPQSGSWSSSITPNNSKTKLNN
ncbi:MAG: hypothetical protein PW788_02545 [Micavibrio sp.]|nr:hypothetical protein [Micavibrio sp.]